MHAKRQPRSWRSARPASWAAEVATAGASAGSHEPEGEARGPNRRTRRACPDSVPGISPGRGRLSSLHGPTPGDRLDVLVLAADAPPLRLAGRDPGDPVPDRSLLRLARR